MFDDFMVILQGIGHGIMQWESLEYEWAIPTCLGGTLN